MLLHTLCQTVISSLEAAPPSAPAGGRCVTASKRQRIAPCPATLRFASSCTDVFAGRTLAWLRRNAATATRSGCPFPVMPCRLERRAHRRHMLSWILLDNAESTAVSLHGGKPFPAVIPRARTCMDLRPESSSDIPPRETRGGQTVSQPFPGTPAAAAAPASRLFAQAATPLPDIDDATFADWIDRYANARVVLLGEASHGTAEFYRARTRLTQRLIADHGFSVVAVEADWPDAAAVDRYVRHRSAPPASAGPNFARFPTWMWRNTEVAALSSGCANSMPCVRPRNAPAFSGWISTACRRPWRPCCPIWNAWIRWKRRWRGSATRAWRPGSASPRAMAMP